MFLLLISDLLTKFNLVFSAVQSKFSLLPTVNLLDPASFPSSSGFYILHVCRGVVILQKETSRKIANWFSGKEMVTSEHPVQVANYIATLMLNIYKHVVSDWTERDNTCWLRTCYSQQAKKSIGPENLPENLPSGYTLPSSNESVLNHVVLCDCAWFYLSDWTN